MLHRGFSIFFLFVYTLVLFQPLVPLIDYVLHKDYIVKNLCENRKKPGRHCNGKCYLVKELNKTGKELPAGTTSQKGSSSEEMVVHLLNSFQPDLKVAQTINVYAQFESDYVSLPFVDGNERPPCA